MTSPDVVVVGGGIVGLACAHALAGRGLAVELVERDRLGGAASGAAAGMLAPLAEAAGSRPLFAAALAARDAWPAFVAALEEESGLFVDYDKSGALVVDVDGSEEGERLAALADRCGEPWARLRDEALRDQVPDLAVDVKEALVLPGEHRVDNRLVCRALAIAARERGVRLLEGQTVTAIHVDAAGAGVRIEGPGWRRSAGRALLAAGAWSGTIAGLPPLPVRPVAGEMLRIHGCAWPWHGSVRGPELYAVRRAGGALLVGATVADAGFAAEVTPRGQRALLDFVLRVFPGLAEQPIARAWAGVRPGTLDGLPLLGALEGDAVWIATGHYRNGILLAPWTAARIADAMAGEGGEQVLPAAFSPARERPEGA